MFCKPSVFIQTVHGLSFPVLARPACGNSAASSQAGRSGESVERRLAFNEDQGDLSSGQADVPK